MELRIAGIVKESIVDGPGIRYTVFVQGCPHGCPGCHNPYTHSFNGGTIMTTQEIFDDIKRNPLLDGVTFSGGEPFCQAKALSELADMVHSIGLNVITYTGWTFEYLYEKYKYQRYGVSLFLDWYELLNKTDILIDGPFMELYKSYDTPFRGSSNQRILDCKESVMLEKAVIKELS